MGLSTDKWGLWGLQLTGSKRPFEWNNLSVFGLLQKPSHIAHFLKQIKAFILSGAALIPCHIWPTPVRQSDPQA